MEMWNSLLEIVLLLGAALLAGGVMARFGQSPLVGYLLAGMVMGGPSSLHVVKSEKQVEAIAELGVSLLLFSLGLEFSLHRLRSLGARVLLGGLFQVLVTTVVGALAAAAVGLGNAEAIAVGAMVSLSSTACVLRVLMENADIDTAHGRNSLAVLLVQDMAVVPLAILMALLSGGGDASDVAWRVGRIALLASGLVVGLYIVLDKIAVAALGTLTLERNRELTLILAVVTGLGSACAAHAIGISPALGAFVAGMFLGNSPFATQIRADVSSLRTVLLTLFFGAAGMVADPVWIFHNWQVVVGVTVALVFGKAVIVWAIYRALKQPHQIALASGICLAQIGEFAFVLGSIGRAGGVLSEDVHLLIVSVAIITLVMCPFLTPRSPQIAFAIASRLFGSSLAAADKGATASRDSPEVVIFGFGPAGRLAAQPLLGQPIRTLIVDLNRENVEQARKLGLEAIVGDATQVEVLEHAHLHLVRFVAITIPNRRAAIEILAQVRQIAPAAHVVVRSRYQQHSHEFEDAGAHAVFGDEEEIGSRLRRAAADWLAASTAKSNDDT